MTYAVKQLFPNRPEQWLENFFDKNKAIDSIKKRLSEDANFSRKVAYRLYEDDELVSEWDQAKWQQMQAAHPSSTNESSASSRTSTSSFRPTPLPTAPRPPGTAPKTLIDDPQDKKEK